MEAKIWEYKEKAVDLYKSEIQRLDDQFKEDIDEFERKLPSFVTFDGELAKCQLEFQSDYEEVVNNVVAQQEPETKEKKAPKKSSKKASKE